MNKKLLLIGIILALCIISMTSLVFASIHHSEEKGMEVVVQQGDTLWDIAGRYHQQADMSIQELVFYIKQANHLHSAIIQPGDKLVIPTK